ncbi:MAG: TetR/AcrR family transcriptional regulator [Chloroflexota bacterium]
MTILDKPLTSRQQHAEARRSQILETALRLFALHGFNGVSTKQIAQEVGVTEGLIFHYFASKEDLLNAVIETRHSFFGSLRELLSSARGMSTQDVLPMLAGEWLKTLRRESAITSIMFAEAQTNAKVGEALQGLIAGGVSLLADYLQERVSAGELRADLPLKTSAQMFFSSLMIFFVAHRHLSKAQWEARSTAFVQEMFSTWFQGARA